MSKISNTARFYGFICIITFLFGILPIIFNFIIDPYEINKVVDIGIEKKKISEKAHYPLWKVAHYPEETSDVIILGDSRARSLRDKYWHQLGLTGAYNFAYGGATVYEIYDTFQIIKHNKNLKTLVIGIQLRSLDVNFKNGLNRVPEAIRLNENPLQYYSNWFVSKISYKNLQNKYKAEFKRLSDFKPSLFTPANAREIIISEAIINEGKTLENLLEIEVCTNCILPEHIAPSTHPSFYENDTYYFADNLGIWKSLWTPIHIERELPIKFQKQVKRNAASDWRKFKFSEQFWSYLVEISTWCDQNYIKLIFIIPPTIVEMQNRVIDYGHGELDHDFRKRLTTLGLVIDFDFDNHLTRDLDRFTDAYHIDYKTAKLIVGEIAQLTNDNPDAILLAQKRRKDIICPITSSDILHIVSDNFTEVREGKACRIWSSQNVH